MPLPTRAEGGVGGTGRYCPPPAILAPGAGSLRRDPLGPRWPPDRTAAGVDGQLGCAQHRRRALGQRHLEPATRRSTPNETFAVHGNANHWIIEGAGERITGGARSRGGETASACSSGQARPTARPRTNRLSLPLPFGLRRHDWRNRHQASDCAIPALGDVARAQRKSPQPLVADSPRTD